MHCDKFEREYIGAESSAVKELKATLAEDRIDAMKWITHCHCTVCGQHWEKRMEDLGHGDVPVYYKVGKG
jgi:hypothetical protein